MEIEIAEQSGSVAVLLAAATQPAGGLLVLAAR
jgi:hypothetical protein